MKFCIRIPLVATLFTPLAALTSAAPMEEVVATAPAPSPSDSTSLLLDQQTLQANRGQSLGELLETLPGVSNASFGQGVARPVIRGLSGNRVQIFSNGSDSADLSAMSSDHSPMVDLAASDAVELLRGPAALRYHASPGGTINVLDQRIQQQEFDGWRGDLASGFASNGNARLAVARLDAGNGQSILHLDGFWREANDYSAGEGGDRSGIVANSDIHNEGAALGVSRIFDNGGYAGISVAHLQADYAVPNATDADVRVTPDQTRYDVQTGRPLQSGLWTYWRLQLAHNDYRHEEWRANLAEGLFLQDFRQLRSELEYQTDSSSGTLGIDINRRQLQLCHDHSGCPAIPDYSSQSWDGSTGADFTLYEGYLFAHDTPMPLTTSRDLALFATHLRELGAGQLELAGRWQPRRIDADPDSIRSNFRHRSDYYRQRRYAPWSLALSWQQAVTDFSDLRLGLSRLQRAPVADELYWNGDHHATFSFQLDNPDLQVETAYSVDIGWQGYHQGQQWQLDAYFYDWRNYIYNRLQDFGDPYHGNHVYRHEQEDARMAGLDGQWQYPLDSVWQLQTRAALVRGWLNDNGSPLPRLPADNLSLVLQRQLPQGHWWLGLDAWADQHRRGHAETATPGWYQLNLGWHHQQALASGSLHLDLEGRNLTNRYGRYHSSWLKDYAPVPGRTLRLQVRWEFEAG